MLNKWSGIGNLGRDAEVKYTPGGQAVANFSIGCTEKWMDREGQRKERTEWVRCVLWGKQAESLQQYLVKGKQVYIEGGLQTRQWDDKDGNKRYTTEIRVDRVQLLGGGSGGGRGRRDDTDRQHEQRQDVPVGGGFGDDDDIPFGPVGFLG